MRKSVLVLAPSLLVGALLAVAGPVGAASRGIINVSPSIPLTEKSYPGMTAAKPDISASGSAPYAQTRNCGDGDVNAAYCDQFDLKVKTPSGYNELYKIRVTLTWDPGAANNIMSILIFDFEDPYPQQCCGPPIARDDAPGKKPPRIVQIGEPPTKTFFVSVVNDGPGPNSGYTLKTEWVVIKLGSYPGAPKDDGPAPTFSPIPPQARTPTYTNPALTTPIADGEETITVKVPGPDGELIDVEIPLVKAAGLARKAETASSPVVPIILGLLGLGLVLFLYFFVWRRRRGEETA